MLVKILRKTATSLPMMTKPENPEDKSAQIFNSERSSSTVSYSHINACLFCMP